MISLNRFFFFLASAAVVIASNNSKKKSDAAPQKAFHRMNSGSSNASSSPRAAITMKDGSTFTPSSKPTTRQNSLGKRSLYALQSGSRSLLKRSNNNETAPKAITAAGENASPAPRKKGIRRTSNTETLSDGTVVTTKTSYNPRTNVRVWSRSSEYHSP